MVGIGSKWDSDLKRKTRRRKKPILTRASMKMLAFCAPFAEQNHQWASSLCRPGGRRSCVALKGLLSAIKWRAMTILNQSNSSSCLASDLDFASHSIANAQKIKSSKAPQIASLLPTIFPPKHIRRLKRCSILWSNNQMVSSETRIWLQFDWMARCGMCMKHRECLQRCSCTNLSEAVQWRNDFGCSLFATFVRYHARFPGNKRR